MRGESDVEHLDVLVAAEAQLRIDEGDDVVRTRRRRRAVMGASAPAVLTTAVQPG